MGLASPMITDNSNSSLPRAWAAGDVLNTKEFITDINNAAGVTYTAANLLSGIIGRRGAAGVSDTFPDAASFVNAIIGQSNYQGSGATTPVGIEANSTYRLRLVNGNAATLTLVGGTNFTLVTTWAPATIAANASRDCLITILNGTPSQVFAATTTNGSAVVTGMSAAQTSLLTPGMAVSGTGIPASTTILSIQPGVGVTLSANATATGTLVALTFGPRCSFSLV